MLLIILLQNSMGKISFTTDMWSDTNLSPFAAYTAHWIEGKTVQTIHGPQLTLTLRADLIGFQRVPGRHTGEHLAQAFLVVVDRLGITHKVCLKYSSLVFSADSCSRLGGSLWTMLTTTIRSCVYLSVFYGAVTLSSTQSSHEFGEFYHNMFSTLDSIHHVGVSLTSSI